MYADPKHIRQHRVNLSLSEAERRFVEAAAELNGMQPSVYMRELVLSALLGVRHEANSAYGATEMRATQ